MVKTGLMNVKEMLRIGGISAALMAASSYLFELNLYNTLLNVIIAVIFSPILVICKDRARDEKDRFYEAVIYLEQMIYSFLKFPKIREALLDVYEISSGRLHRTLKGALELIDDGNEINIFNKAFKRMEQVYNCQHVYSLHKYLVKLETEGGEYEVFLNLILKDIKNWSNAVIEFRLDTSRKKRNVLFAIAVTIITSGIMVRLVPDEFSYINSIAYKIVVSICLILLYLVYVYMEVKLSKSWLENYHQMSEERAVKYDRIIQNGVSKKEKVVFSVISLIFIIFSFVLFISQKSNVTYFIMLLGIMVYLYPKLKYKRTLKRMTSEFQKAYSEWLLEFGMNLQSETVQTSLYHSYRNAPNVLKPELERVLRLMVTHPVSIKPYDEFLKKYELSEMKSSFRMLYPMQSLEHEQVIKHLEMIVERSQRISRKSFVLQQEDKLGMLNMLVSAPSLIGILMIMTSIILLITNFSNVLNNSMSGLSSVLGG